MPEVGSTLGSDPAVGGDARERFATDPDAVQASAAAQLAGCGDDVFVARTALSAKAIRRLVRRGIDLCMRAD